MMKAPLIAILLLSAAMAGDDEFTSGMKAVKGAMDSLSKLESKTGDTAAGDAERVASVYENMIPFWRQRDAANAVKWSEEGKYAATRLASAAFGNDAAKAADAFKTLNATCKPCHDARRERTAEGKYRIKSPAQ